MTLWVRIIAQFRWRLPDKEVYMKIIRIVLVLWVGIFHLIAQPGILKVGFDIDDTVLFSRDVFLNAPRDETGEVNYSWVNLHDADYSIVIPPTIALVDYFRAHGHEVYFITSRPGINGTHVASFLTMSLGFDIELNRNLFFAPKESINGKRYTTKHRVMSALGLDLYYGDSDTDMIAAIKAGVHPVRVVRHQKSVEQYGSNYFGNTLKQGSEKYPFGKEDLQIFYNSNVGVFGESIYPIIWEGPPE